MGFAVMHAAPVVPKKHISRPPNMAPDEFLLAGVLPQKVEQFFALLVPQSIDVLRWIHPPPAQVESFPPGNGMGADERVMGAGHL